MASMSARATTSRQSRKRAAGGSAEPARVRTISAASARCLPSTSQRATSGRCAAVPSTNQLIRKGRKRPTKKVATPGLKSGQGRKRRIAAPQRRGVLEELLGRVVANEFEEKVAAAADAAKFFEIASPAGFAFGQGEAGEVGETPVKDVDVEQAWRHPAEGFEVVLERFFMRRLPEDVEILVGGVMEEAIG